MTNTKKDLWSRVRGKCTKKDPSTCRLHGKQIRERIVLERQAVEQVKNNAYKEKAQKDFTASWNVKEEKDGSTTVSVYRSGVVEAPTERGVEAPSYVICDTFMPEGRQGRTTGIFASPTLGGVGRWVYANSGMTSIPDFRPREIRVDIDKTWVYSIRSWEVASSKETEEAYKGFWDTGITMREYMELSQKEPHNYKAEDWELLIPKDGVRSVKNVSAERVASVAYSQYRASDILEVLKKNRR